VVAVAGENEKDGAVRAWLAGVARVCARVRLGRGSRLWSCLGTSAGTLGTTWLGDYMARGLEGSYGGGQHGRGDQD
jgi:hypothetical protein